MFTPDFFGWQGETPFGKDWVLTPESYDKGDTYLGYSIEASCKTKKVSLDQLIVRARVASKTDAQSYRL